MSQEEPSSERIELEPDLAPGMEPEEGELTRRSIRRYTPEQQGLEIPAGWKPTTAKPIPVVRCIYVRPDNHPVAPGERCNKWSLRGSRLCFFHAGRGNLKHVETYRQAVVESARLMITDSAPEAVKVMVDLMSTSGADNVRLKAAESILDRAGIKTAEQLDVNLSVSEATPALTLAQRLDTLRKAATDVQRREEEEQQRLALPAAADETEIVDAEIVPTPEDGG